MVRPRSPVDVSSETTEKRRRQKREVALIARTPPDNRQSTPSRRRRVSMVRAIRWVCRLLGRSASGKARSARGSSSLSSTGAMDRGDGPGRWTEAERGVHVATNSAARRARRLSLSADPSSPLMMAPSSAHTVDPSCAADAARTRGRGGSWRGGGVGNAPRSPGTAPCRRRKWRGGADIPPVGEARDPGIGGVGRTPGEPADDRRSVGVDARVLLAGSALAVGGQSESSGRGRGHRCAGRRDPAASRRRTHARRGRRCGSVTPWPSPPRRRALPLSPRRPSGSPATGPRWEGSRGVRLVTEVPPSRPANPSGPGAASAGGARPERGWSGPPRSPLREPIEPSSFRRSSPPPLRSSRRPSRLRRKTCGAAKASDLFGRGTDGLGGRDW